MSDVDVVFKDGKLQVSAFDGNVELVVKAAMVVNPLLDDVKAKLESGEIDPIKGTDLDKDILLKAVEFLKAELNK